MYSATSAVDARADAFLSLPSLVLTPDSSNKKIHLGTPA
jgi:hypothetical protein